MVQNKKKIDKSTDFQVHVTILEILHMGKLADTTAMIKPFPFQKRGDRVGVFLRVKQALRRKVTLKLVWFTTQGFYFVVENLIFPRPFLLGVSLKSALYWEIGMKSTALKRIKAFVSKMYVFFGTIKAMELEVVLGI